MHSAERLAGIAHHRALLRFAVVVIQSAELDAERARHRGFRQSRVRAGMLAAVAHEHTQRSASVVPETRRSQRHERRGDTRRDEIRHIVGSRRIESSVLTAL